jgi:thioredoxin 1
MLKVISTFFLAAFLLVSCSIGQGSTKTDLSPKEFSKQLKETENPTIFDVRTPGEFGEGHIQNALNIDWNGSSFDAQVSKLDKNTTVFVYCLSGGRSGSAASQLRSNGFKNVLELDGGMMAWRSASLPETKDSKVVKSTGMTTSEFEKLLQTDKVVLVDFYAEWCGPCKKMKPSILAIENEMASSVKVIRIDVDKNAELVKSFGILEIPILRVYKQGKITCEQKGFVEKEEIKKNL